MQKTALSAFVFMCGLAGLQSARAGDINLKLVDKDGKPIAGVTCSQNGGPSATSDAAGSLLLSGVTGIVAPKGTPMAAPSLSRIPLAPGQRAKVEIIDFRGRSVLSREIGAGQAVDFSSREQGLFLVKVSAQGFSARGRIANMGGGIHFEGVPREGSAYAAKTAAAPGPVSITCSKTGFNTQVYRLIDGDKATIDFSKLNLVPLYDASTAMEPATVLETDSALITRFADRGRDRHGREDEFHIYDHFLGHYWVHRTAQIEIIDKVAKGGKEVIGNVITEWPLGSTNFRAFYRGIGTVAEYYANNLMTAVPGKPNTYTTKWTMYPKKEKEGISAQPLNRPLQIGDRMEMEVSQFLANPPEGRANYYGTVYLYVIGKGMAPWEPRGIFKNNATELEDSYPLPMTTWIGGATTLPQQTSNEPLYHFIQMAYNLAPINGQHFVLGRRVDHTSFLDGSHDEPDNETFKEMSGLAGPNYVNVSCNACHANNGRALAPTPGVALTQFVVKVGDGNGNPHPQIGSVLQPKSSGGASEGSVSIASWSEANGLRKPNYAFTGTVPAQFSARVSPQLVGMGLLEAIRESDVQALADPDDANKDGISGRMRIVTDYKDGLPHLGRFGWKAGKQSVAHQIAGAFNTDMGVMTSIYPTPDCGTAQSNCGNAGGKEIPDEQFQHLVDYISLLGIRAQRDYNDASVQAGQKTFGEIGCTACHTPGFTTSAYHPHAELRSQLIHPYTDLLLHDMGPGLADNLPEGDATGAEWRTTPLWSIGLSAGVAGGEGYLHDGRARTIGEAVLWHGGEGQAAADRFKALSQGDQDAVVKFLKSL